MTIFSFNSCLDKAVKDTPSLEETDMPVYKWKGTYRLIIYVDMYIF